jgi:DNA polymerase-3 subunit gamma/tau
MVFYRKYRPQKIEELDSKSVRDKLYSVLESKSVSHAFLFTGPKGLGKTSTARIVAKSLNCEVSRGKRVPQVSRVENLKTTRGTRDTRKSRDTLSVEPCNKCEQCISITKGTNLDILEIDGASNRGIDEIRDLREKVKLSPLSARKKVYIIDEVHMLTQEAFNALLKTLEEPPSHVVFILCTTEPHKVPATIKSRCLQIQFKKAAEEELVRSFERIVKAEKLKADKKALNLIAGLSDGSFRDGVKILEEMSLVSKNKKITTELVEQKFQISSIEYQIAELIRCLEEKDTKSSLMIVSKIVEDGIEMGYFIEELINKLHSLMLAKIGVGEKLEIGNWKLEIGELKRLIEMLSKAASELKYAVLPQIPLELVIVEWGLSARGPVGLYPHPTSSVAPLPAGARWGSPASATPRVDEAPKITQQNMAGYNENDALWTALIDKVKTYNHSIAGVLRGCRIKSYDGKTLLLETNFKFHKDKLGERKTQEILEEACKEIARKNVKIEVELKGGDKA